MYRCCFFGVFLRETALTEAKSRNNLSTNSGKATKLLDRLAPHLEHMCRFIWEWIYAKQIAPRDSRGTYLRGVDGVNIKKVGGSYQTARPIGTNFGSRLRVHLGMGIG